MAIKEASSALFIAPIAPTITTEDLAKFFDAPAHRVIRAERATGARGRPRTFAFVEFSNSAAAEAARRARDGAQLGGRRVEIRIAEDDRRTR